MSTPISKRPKLTPPDADSNKYTRGKLVVIAGAMPGAATLAALAAMRVGTGYVALAGVAGTAPPHALVRTSWDATALADPRIGGIVVGPGLGQDRAARDRLAASLAAGRPLLLDADALTLIGRERPRLGASTLLTPHEGEFARLGDWTGDRSERAEAAARDLGAVVLLKGSQSVLAAPDGRVFVAPPAPAWLATAGTGDVLAGIGGGLLAQGMAPFEAGRAALWLHAEAARLAGPFLIADDLITALPSAAAACL